MSKQRAIMQSDLDTNPILVELGSNVGDIIAINETTFDLDIVEQAIDEVEGTVATPPVVTDTVDANSTVDTATVVESTPEQPVVTEENTVAPATDESEGQAAV